MAFNYTDPTLTVKEKKEFEKKRAAMFKGTIAVCVIYGTIALGMLALIFFTQTGRMVLTEQMMPFTATFVAGTILVMVVLVLQLLSFKPTKIPRSPFDAGACPDYWITKQTPAWELRKFPAEEQHLMKYRCVPDPRVFDMKSIDPNGAATSMTGFLTSQITGSKINMSARMLDAAERTALFANGSTPGDVKQEDAAVELSCRNPVYDADTADIILPGKDWNKAPGATTPVAFSFFARTMSGSATLTPMVVTTKDAIVTPSVASTDTAITTQWKRVNASFTVQGSVNTIALRLTLTKTKEKVQITNLQVTRPELMATVNYYGHSLLDAKTPFKTLKVTDTPSEGKTQLYNLLPTMYAPLNTYPPVTSTNLPATAMEGKVVCNKVYPDLVGNYDERLFPDTRNNIRCAYKEACGVPWSSVCPSS